MKFCIIGLGKFGYHLAVSLADQGNEVLAIDKEESVVDSIKEHVTQAICANIIDEETLLAVGIEDIQSVIVAIGEDFAQSTLLTALLKKVLHKQFVIARASNDLHETVLKLVGADRVISLEKNMAMRLAKKLSMPIGDFVEISGDFATTQFKLPKQYAGKAVKEVIVPAVHKVACIGVRKGKNINLINSDYVILENDVLLFAGSRKALAGLIHF